MQTDLSGLINNILIVDDNEFNILTLELLLEDLDLSPD